MVINMKLVNNIYIFTYSDYIVSKVQLLPQYKPSSWCFLSLINMQHLLDFSSILSNIAYSIDKYVTSEMFSKCSIQFHAFNLQLSFTRSCYVILRTTCFTMREHA